MKTISLKSRMGVLIPFCIMFFSITLVSGQSPPNFGATESFALFTASGAFTNTGASVIVGDVGTHVGAFTGFFPPGSYTGMSHVADGVSATAATDVDLAYMYLDALPSGAVTSAVLDGLELMPGTHTIGALASLSAGSTLTLNAGGNPHALFFIQIDAALNTGSGSSILLAGNASACNVFWQVNGAVSIGEGALFQGMLFNNGAINLLEGSTFNGRGLSRGGAISTHTVEVNSIIDPIPSTIIADGPLAFCSGDSVILSGNLGGVWNTGETTDSITVLTSGTYYVTNYGICDSINSDSFVVSVISDVPPIISADGSTSFCLGDSVILTSTVSTNYLWSNGDTTQSITVTTSGMYSVETGCGGGMSNVIEVTVSQFPVPTITADGPTTFCLADSVILTSSAAGSYEWSTGATTQSITVYASGSYFVTTDGICVSNTIDVIVNEEPGCGEAIPTLGQWALIVLTLLFCISGVLFAKRVLVRQTS